MSPLEKRALNWMIKHYLTKGYKLSAITFSGEVRVVICFDDGSQSCSCRWLIIILRAGMVLTPNLLPCWHCIAFSIVLRTRRKKNLSW